MPCMHVRMRSDCSCIPSPSPVHRHGRQTGILSDTTGWKSAGALNDVFKDKYESVRKANLESFWTRRRNPEQVLEMLSGLHTELSNAFALQMLAGHFEVR